MSGWPESGVVRTPSLVTPKSASVFSKLGITAKLTRRGDPVATARSHVAHRDHYRNLGVAPALHRTADAFGGGCRPAGRIDSHYQRLVSLIDIVIEQAGNTVAARFARPGIAVDDVTGHGHHGDSLAGGLGRIGLQPCRKARVGIRQIAIARGARQFGHVLVEFGLVAQLVDEADGFGRLCEVPTGRLDRGQRISSQFVDLRLGLPRTPQRAVDVAVILARLGRHVLANVRLDKALVGPDAVDVRVDVEAVDQSLEVLRFTAWPHHQRFAHWIHPDFAGMCCKLNGVVHIDIGECQDRLSGLAHLVHGPADLAQVDEAPAHEARQVEDDDLDPVVLGGKVQCAFDVAGLVFTRRCFARKKHAQRIDLALFLDDHAVQVEQKRAFLDMPRRGPGREHGIYHAEEQDQKRQRQRILDADQQLPDLARELHEYTCLSSC